MKYIVIIPARYQSTRFPGKPLAKIGGEEMIIRVCKQVEKTGFPLAVATDNEEIARCVRSYGFNAIMTSADHKSGTERVEEAFRKIKANADVIINVQGDEPFISPHQIKDLTDIFERHPETQIATLARKFDPELGIETLNDPNLVKLVISNENKALYFSRNIIPFVRGYSKEDWLKKTDFLTHIGIYGYKAECLSDIVKLKPSDLETAESLEQLRWLQNGYQIGVGLSEFQTIGIDTPEDLKNAEKYLSEIE